MSKIIELGKEGREKLLKGIEKLSTAVTSTLGPNGRNVIFMENGQVRSTKDGVTVAKQIELEDPIENAGAEFIKQASLKTANIAGDGTTTSTLLSKTIIDEGKKLLEADPTLSVSDLKNGINKASKSVIEILKTKIKKDISSADQIKQIASISANNDPSIGEMVSQALSEVGKDGVVYVEESKSGDDELEIVEGMQFDRGYKSHLFVTNNNNMTCILDNPYILITDKRFTNAKDLLDILNKVATENRSLLIICDDIDGEALALLVVNKLRGNLKVCAVKAPEFGDRKKLILDDIAILTGGIIVNEEKGIKFDDKFNLSWLGQARTVSVDKDETTIVGGKGEKEQITKRINELKCQIEDSKTPFEKEKLQGRLAKLGGGVTIIHVGGLTETEIKEKKDRVDDALQATKAAIQEGIVPGGGVALIHAGEILKNTRASNDWGNEGFIGTQIILKACKAPLIKILENAGYDKDEIYRITNEISSDTNNYWKGYDLRDKMMVDMLYKGIIDPAKVTRVALENAVSVASTVLLTEAIIVDKPQQKENNDLGNMNGLY